MDEIINIVVEVIKIPFNYLLSPGKRVFWLYLLTSFFLSLFVYQKTKNKISFKKYFFNFQRWIGTSAIVDYCLIFFNSIVKVVVLSPLLIYALYIAEGINEYLTANYGISTFNWSITSIVVTYTITIVVVNDFFSFLIR